MGKVHVHVHKVKDAGGKVQPATLAEAIRKAEAIVQVLKAPAIKEMETDDFREGIKGLNTAYNWFK